MIQNLAYVGVRSNDAMSWIEFAGQLGMEVAEGTSGEVRIAIDDRPWRLSIEDGASAGVRFIGWDVAADGFDTLLERATTIGSVVHEDTGLAEARNAERAGWCIDPAGFRHEFVVGVTTSEPVDLGFVTGAQGMGHLVLMVPDMSAAVVFATDVLGMRISDTIEVGSGLVFLHCVGSEARHHALAFSEVRGMRGLHHVMVEMADLDDVGRAYDRLRSSGHRFAMDLGRHTNDLMTSFYVRTPSGFELEVGAGGRIVDDDTWQVERFDAMSIWGHRPPESGPLRPGMIERI